jgi:hypothetical protein
MLEKARLQALLKVQRDLIHHDFREIKEELAPIKSIITTVSKLTSQQPGSLLMTGTANTLIDLVLKKFVLARTGWFTRVIIPYFIKNYASHFIADKKDTIIQKITSFFRKKPVSANGNGKMHDVNEED